MKQFIALLFTFGLSTQALACNIPEKELLLRLILMKADQAQEMSLNTPERQYEDSNISKSEFKKVIESVKKVYVPIFKRQNMNFRIEHAWDDNQPNAYAGVRGKDRYILLYGGYARHRLMTKDAFMSIICHEIGHHLGGFPRKHGSAWSSSEGQADYFSTLKCMKEVLRTYDDNEQVAALLDLPSEVQKQCRHQFQRQVDYFICLRSAKAAEVHGRVIADLISDGSNTEVSLLTPDKDVRSVTNLQHPSPQCRVDTKYQGALCNVSTSIALDPVDETKGTCHLNNFNILGARPACWFAHKK